MPDAVELVKVLKKAAVEAMNAEKPAEIRFGKVVGVSPLQIAVGQKLRLGRSQLVLTRNVTDYRAYLETGNARTHGGPGSPPDVSSVDADREEAAGRVEVTVCNGLVVGDEVLLLRQQGGQKYIVWDRLA